MYIVYLLQYLLIIHSIHSIINMYKINNITFITDFNNTWEKQTKNYITVNISNYTYRHLMKWFIFLYVIL